MQIKALALAGLAAISTTFVGAPEAAARFRCADIARGWELCSIDRGHAGTDSVGYFRNGEMVGYLDVICTGNGGNRWSGNRDTRYVSYQDMQNAANWWCRNY